MGAYLKFALCLAVLVPSYGAAQGSESERAPVAEQLTSRVLLGPPKPAFLRDSLGVAAGQLALYVKDYDRHMAHTKVQRSRALAALQKSQTVTQQADQEQGLAAQEPSARDLVGEILREDRRFEDRHLMPLVAPDQRRALREPRMRALRAALRDRKQPHSP